VALRPASDGSEPIRPTPVERLEERWIARSRPAAEGTLACPACDVPVAAAAARLSPADPLGCPFCDHIAAVRDFLTLGTPSRPARVDVRLVPRPRG
jgi:hypothetical protein